MTIVIKKGSDAQRKKSSKLVDSSREHKEGSDDEKKADKSSATDMTDVLDFKVYRIIQPNFYNNTTRVNLIGEAFYRTEDQVKIADLLSHNQIAEVHHAEEMSTIEKMQIMQHKNANVVRARKTELLNRIVESQKEVLALKSGQSIAKSLMPPTLEETIQWAIRFVAMQQEALVLNIINIYYNMKTYDSSIEKLAKQRKKRSTSENEVRSRTSSEYDGRSRAPSEDVAGYDRNSSDEYAYSGRERAASSMSEGEGGGGRDRTVSDSSWDAPPPDRRRGSSRLLSVSASTDASLAAAGDKLHATQQATGRAKHVSLAQQLEQIKSQGTDAFLKCIVPQKESIFPAGKRTWKVQTAHQQPQKLPAESTTSLNSVVEPPPPTSKTGSSTPISPRLVKHHSVVPASKSSKEVANHTGVLSALSEEVVNTEEGASTRLTAGVRDGTATEGKRLQSPPPGHHHPAPPNTASKSQQHDRAVEEHAAHQSQLAQHQPRPPSGSKPSNRGGKPSHGTIRAASPVHSSSAKVEPAKPKPSAIEQAVLQSQQILTALLKKTETMQNHISRKIKRAETAGMRLLEQHHDFNTIVALAEEQAISMVEEREFIRPTALLHQVTSFEEGAELKGTAKTGKKGLKNDLLQMNTIAEKKTFDLYMSRLVKHRWFVAAVLKLRDYMKKMNNVVPDCCLKMIVSVEQVLLMGYSLTEEVFYQLLEGVVTVKEDHQKTIVHQLLKILRDALHISAVDFLKYLEDRDINPHPELSNQVRVESKQQSKKNVAASLRTSMVRMTQMSLSAPSAAKVAFMVPSDSITAGGSLGVGMSASLGAAATAASATVTTSTQSPPRATSVRTVPISPTNVGLEKPRSAEQPKRASPGTTTSVTDAVPVPAISTAHSKGVVLSSS